MKVKKQFPGAIYKNKNRYWWKVKLPGEDKIKYIPLVPEGAIFATSDYSVAVEVAKNIFWKETERTKPVRATDNPKKIYLLEDIVNLYIQFLKSYYRPPSNEAENIKYAIIPLSEIYGKTPAVEFGIVQLKHFRQILIDKEKKLTRGVINRRIQMIKKMFKWAAEEQLIPISIYQSVAIVENLKKGRSDAKETKKIKPANKESIYAVLPFMGPIVRVMCEFQLLTGMRSSEVCKIRPCDIDTSEKNPKKVWFYKPSEHKTAWREHERIIAIGPLAKNLLKPFMDRNQTDFCFTPDETLKIIKNGGKAVQARYDRNSYRKAIMRAFSKAKKAGIVFEKFTPHQLRHTAGTKTLNELGPEFAQAVLGHRHISATEVYAEIDKKLAAKAAAKLG